MSLNCLELIDHIKVLLQHLKLNLISDCKAFLSGVLLKSHTHGEIPQHYIKLAFPIGKYVHNHHEATGTR